MPTPAPFQVTDAPDTLVRTTVQLDMGSTVVKLPAYVDPTVPRQNGTVAPYLPAESVDKLARALVRNGGDDVVSRDGGTVTVTEYAWPDEPTAIAAQVTASRVIVWHLAVGWLFTD